MAKIITEKLFLELLSFTERNSSEEGDEADQLYQELLHIQTEQDIQEMKLDGKYPDPKKKVWLV